MPSTNNKEEVMLTCWNKPLPLRNTETSRTVHVMSTERVISVHMSRPAKRGISALVTPCQRGAYFHLSHPAKEGHICALVTPCQEGHICAHVTPGQRGGGISVLVTPHQNETTILLVVFANLNTILSILNLHYKLI